jgi:DNA invertase Pin-like site-specific DNA recombinase
MDRLARNLDDLRRIIKTITAKQSQVHFVKEGLEFTSSNSPMSNLMLSLMGAFAEFEYGLIRERQLEGIAKAKARGVYERPNKLTDKKIQEIKNIFSKETDSIRINKASIAKQYGITRPTLYYYLKHHCS